MLPRSLNTKKPNSKPPVNASGRVAQAGRWLTMLSDRVAKRNDYVGRLKAAVYADMVGYSRLFRLQYRDRCSPSQYAPRTQAGYPTPPRSTCSDRR